MRNVDTISLRRFYKAAAMVTTIYQEPADVRDEILKAVNESSDRMASQATWWNALAEKAAQNPPSEQTIAMTVGILDVIADALDAVKADAR